MGRKPLMDEGQIMPETSDNNTSFSDLGSVKAFESISSTFSDTNKDLLLRINPLLLKVENSIRKRELLASLPDMQSAMHIIELYKQIVRNQSEIISSANKLIEELKNTFSVTI